MIRDVAAAGYNHKYFVFCFLPFVNFFVLNKTDHQKKEQGHYDYRLAAYIEHHIRLSLLKDRLVNQGRN